MKNVYELEAIGNNGEIKFFPRLTIEDKTFDSYTFNCPSSDIKVYDAGRFVRFAIEQIFRSFGFNKVRLDGKAAKLSEQTLPEYMDYEYYTLCNPRYSVYPAESQLINKTPIICDGLARDPYTVVKTCLGRDLRDLSEQVKKEVAARKAAFSAVVVTPVPSQNEGKSTLGDNIDYIANFKNAILGELTQKVGQLSDEEKEGSKDIIDLTNKFLDQYMTALENLLKEKEESKKAAEGTIQNEEPDVTLTAPIQSRNVPPYVQQDLKMEPFASNPILLSLKQIYDKAGVRVNFYSDPSGLIWAYAYTGKENNFSKKHSLIIDPEGLIYGGSDQVIKFFAYKDTGYVDQADFFACEDTSFKELLQFLSTTKFPKTNSETAKKFQNLNKVVEVSTIKGQGRPDGWKVNVVSVLLDCIGDLRTYVKENNGARFVLESAADDVSTIRLRMSESCTRHFGDDPCGPKETFFVDVTVVDNKATVTKVAEQKIAA